MSKLIIKIGIFNEHSNNNTFAKGIQGAPGVGFNLTSDGDYDMVNKKLRNVGAPSVNTDAATKKYVDDNSSGSPATSRLTVDSDIDMKDTYRILKLKSPSDADEPTTKSYTDNLVNNKLDDYLKLDGTIAMNGDFNTGGHKIINLQTPTSNSEPATKSYTDNNFLKLDGTKKITGNLDMDNNRILNLPAPAGPKQPTPLAFTDLKYLHVAGTNKMTNNLNMDNKKIINLRPPTSDTDATTKKYVDDNTAAPDLSDYLEKDGTVAMTGNLNLNNNKIINLNKPTQNNEAATKDYTDKLVHHTAVQPSHYNDQFSYLMSSSNQWTDEIDGGDSFNITKIDDLPPSKGNFHDYNHKVLYTTIYKNSQGGYKYKMGINFYRLTANVDYTLCLELLNTDYQLWHKSQITVDKGTSTGISIGNVGVRKLSHRYITSTNKVEFMYYHRIIVNFRKLSSGRRFFLHFLVNIPQTGTDLAIYPRQFSGVYMIAYGIVGTVSNLDPNETYDYHTAFDIQPTQVVYNVDINANNKKILNIALDKNSNNSAATVGMVNELIPFTTNYVYRKYFEEYYDFTDTSIYGLNIGSSGVIINSLKPNIVLPNLNIANVKENGLSTNGTITFNTSNNSSKFTLITVFNFIKTENFSISIYNKNNNQLLLFLYYLKINRTLNLHLGNIRKNIPLPNSFDGKKVVLYLAGNSNANVTKIKISNYSSTLTTSSAYLSNNLKFEFLNQGGVINKFIYSQNFYDTDSEEYHKIITQEKLNGSYIM